MQTMATPNLRCGAMGPHSHPHAGPGVGYGSEGWGAAACQERAGIASSRAGIAPPRSFPILIPAPPGLALPAEIIGASVGAVRVDPTLAVAGLSDLDAAFAAAEAQGVAVSGAVPYGSDDEAAKARLRQSDSQAAAAHVESAHDSAGGKGSNDAACSSSQTAGDATPIDSALSRRADPNVSLAPLFPPMPI